MPAEPGRRTKVAAPLGGHERRPLYRPRLRQGVGVLFVSLWQTLREPPMEASRETDYLPHDGPLREDVGRLGHLVGRMLAEQGGEDFFERVEAVRQAAIHRRRE